LAYVRIASFHPERSARNGVILSEARAARGVEGRRIVTFYEGGATDDRGRSLDDIMRFDDEQLERVHDFI
jgi:hypothetical protein